MYCNRERLCFFYFVVLVFAVLPLDPFKNRSSQTYRAAVRPRLRLAFGVISIEMLWLLTKGNGSLVIMMCLYASL